MAWLEILIKGMVLGFLASIPLGPIGVICIQRTLGKGKWSGLVSGLGAASADTLIAIIAGLGLSFVIKFFNSNSNILVILGGLILVVLGARIFFKSPVQQVRERKMNKNNLHTDYLSVLILTFSNPFTIIVFIAIFARLNLVYDAHDFILKMLIFFGIFIGASFWWFLLTSFVNIYRAKFRLKNLWWLNKITGTIIIAFGVWLLFSAFFLSKH